MVDSACIASENHQDHTLQTVIDNNL